MTTTARTTASTSTRPYRVGEISWRTVAFATAIIWATAIGGAIAVHMTTPHDGWHSETICAQGISVTQTTDPRGHVTRAAPSDLPACTSPHAPEDK